MAKKAKSAATAAAARKIVKPAVDKIKVPGGRRGKRKHFAPRERSGVKGMIKEAGLPTKGKIRFVPRPQTSVKSGLAKGRRGGYIDKFGNEWTKGPSRTKGEPYEWDVQLSPQGRNMLGHLSPDNPPSHLNVSLGGRITH